MNEPVPPSQKMAANVKRFTQLSHNPILKKLGLSPHDRAVLFHADDIGMAQASLQAYVELLEFGLAPVASVMAPCPWFPATAAYCRQHPHPGEEVDMGVHLTLNSEWDTYRWGPLSTRDDASGLIDGAGYFHSRARELHRVADTAAVRVELQVQIERALAAGIDVTHLDSHMFALLHPRFLPIYFGLAWQYRLPAFMIRADAALLLLRQEGVEAEAAALMVQQLQQAEEAGIPLFDHVYVMPLEPVADRLEHARQVLANLPAGITYFVTHPAKDTPELRAMAPDWPARVGDYQLFLSDMWRNAVRDAGVHLIGYRLLRDLMQ